MTWFIEREVRLREVQILLPGMLGLSRYIPIFVSSLSSLNHLSNNSQTVDQTHSGYPFMKHQYLWGETDLGLDAGHVTVGKSSNLSLNQSLVR